MANGPARISAIIWVLFLNDKVKSAAYIKSQIFDQGQIDGRFTKESGEDLALTLKSGALAGADRLSGRKNGWTEFRRGFNSGRCSRFSGRFDFRYRVYAFLLSRFRN